MQPDQPASAADPASKRRPAPRSAAAAAPARPAPARLALPAAALADRASGLIRPGRRVLLGITGAPGAGKSTAAEQIRRALGGRAAVVGMDGFHLAQAELIRLGRQDRKGAPDTFDSYGYAALLKRLRENLDPAVYAPVFRRDIEEPVGSCLRVDRATPLVIIEGNYLLLDGDGWTTARQQLDEVWFLDLPDEVRQQRLTLRHQEFGKDPAAARRWATGSDQANASLVQAHRDAADVIITVTGE